MFKLLEAQPDQSPRDMARAVRLGAAHQLAEQRHRQLYVERGRLDDEIRDLSGLDRNKKDIAARILALHAERNSVQAQMNESKAQLRQMRTQRAERVEQTLAGVQRAAAQQILEHIDALRAAVAQLRECRVEIELAGGDKSPVPPDLGVSHIEHLGHRFA